MKRIDPVKKIFGMYVALNPDQKKLLAGMIQGAELSQQLGLQAPKVEKAKDTEAL